jgi:hypothetical protein
MRRWRTFRIVDGECAFWSLADKGHVIARRECDAVEVDGIGGAEVRDRPAIGLRERQPAGAEEGHVALEIGVELHEGRR